MNLKVLTGMVFASSLLLASPTWADWPVSLGDSSVVHHSQSKVLIDVLANDIGDNLKIIAVNSWSRNGGRASLDDFDGIGRYVLYTPPKKFVDSDTFWYDIVDDQGRTNAAKVTVSIKPLTSRYPDPQPDVVKVKKGTGIRIDVLKNDIASHPEFTEFSTVSEQGGRIVQVDKQLHYTPPVDFTGTDVFWYTMKSSDSREKNTAKVTVEVMENYSPSPYPVTKPDFIDVRVACNREPPRTVFCYPQVLDVLQNDSGKNLKIIRNSAWSLRGGEVNVVDHPISGYFIGYTPKPNDGDGEDKIWYIIEDEVGRKNWGVVTLNVTTADMYP